MTNLALGPTSITCIHSTMITYNPTTNTSSVELFSNYFSVPLSPNVHNDTSLSKASFFNG